MTREETEALVRQALELTFGRKIAPGEPVSQRDEPKWDSLKHVEVLFHIEDSLDIRFDEDEMAGLDSLERLVEAAERLLAA